MQSATGCIVCAKWEAFFPQMSQCLVSFPRKARPPLLTCEQRGKGQWVFASLRYNSSLNFTKLKYYGIGDFPGSEINTITMLFLSSCLETLHKETEKKKKSRLNTVRGCFCCELGLQGLNSSSITCNRCIRTIVADLQSVLDFLCAQPLLCAPLQLPSRAYLLPQPSPEFIMFQLLPLLLVSFDPCVEKNNPG